jgi:hypothetical protein
MFTDGTPDFNSGSRAHTTKFRLTERGYWLLLPVIPSDLAEWIA